MNNQIDNSNYEAFYLDYLEGNLSGDALAAFEAFMAAHPELALEDEALVTLSATDEPFDAVEKLALKKTIDLEDLSTETVSFFLIAREEQLLSPQQEAQLENWLTANAYYRNDARLFAMTKVQANTAEVFAGKAGLKRKQTRVIPMWFTGAAVAAGLALIITLAIPNGNGTTENDTPVASSDSTPGKTHKRGNNTVNPENRTYNPAITNGQEQSIAQQHKEDRSTNISTPVIFPVTHKTQGGTDVATLDKMELRNLNQANEEPLPIAVSVPATRPETPTPVASHDLAWTPIEEMRNPIRPVTDKLSSTLNTPVDLRTAKATKKKQGGFYLKIGKLEISHRSASL